MYFNVLYITGYAYSSYIVCYHRAVKKTELRRRHLEKPVYLKRHNQMLLNKNLSFFLFTPL